MRAGGVVGTDWDGGGWAVGMRQVLREKMFKRSKREGNWGEDPEE